MNFADLASDKLFQLFADQCPNVIFIEAGQRVIYINSRAKEFFGYSPDEIIAEGFDLKHIFNWPEKAELKKELMAKPEQNAEPAIQRQINVVHRDGSEKKCIISVKKIVLSGQDAYLGTITDITDFSMVNRRLLELRQHYWALFEAASDAIFLETIDGVILDCNAAAVRSYGYTKEELLGMNASELVPGDYASSLKVVAEELSRSKFSGRSLLVVATGKRKDNTIFPSEVSITGLEIDKENLYLVTIRDISTRRELEIARKRYDQQLHQLKLLDNFSNVVNGLANDFNNLLTGIMGYADLLHRDLLPSSPAREKARKILDAARKGGEYIQQLISTTGRLPANFQRADLVAVVREMVADLSQMVSKSGILTSLFDEELPELVFDPSQVKIAVENLVKNAVEAASENARISLSISRGDVTFSGTEPGFFGPPMQSGKYIAIKVSDNGSGISYENLPRIFEPFFTTRFSSRGLGLPTVLGIVRRHHGAIMVKSEIGAGSEFTLMFPCKDAGRNEPEFVASQIPDKFPAGAVLVVDDEEAVSEILCVQLNNLGFATHQACDGNAGLNLFKQLNQELSLVIVDLAMPGKSGIELIRELRWLNPEIPVIACSGMSEGMDELAHLGVNTTLHKPFRLADIEQALLKVQFKK